MGIPSIHHAWLIDWWFRTFFIFQYIGYNHPNWLIFCRGVGQPPTSLPCLHIVSTWLEKLDSMNSKDCNRRSWTSGSISCMERSMFISIPSHRRRELGYGMRQFLWNGWDMPREWGNFMELYGSAGPVGLESQSIQILTHTRRKGSSWLVVWNMAFIFHNIWDNPSHWLIFFKMVKTTNQLGYVRIHSNWDLRRDAVGVFPEMPSNPKCLGGSKESSQEPTLTPCRVNYHLVN